MLFLPCPSRVHVLNAHHNASSTFGTRSRCVPPAWISFFSLLMLSSSCNPLLFFVTVPLFTVVSSPLPFPRHCHMPRPHPPPNIYIPLPLMTIDEQTNPRHVATLPTASVIPRHLHPSPTAPEKNPCNPKLLTHLTPNHRPSARVILVRVYLTLKYRVSLFHFPKRTWRFLSVSFIFV